MKKINKEILSLINGSECSSIKYEGCIGIRGNEVLQEGVVIDKINTDKKLQDVWKEFCEEQGIAI